MNVSWTGTTQAMVRDFGSALSPTTQTAFGKVCYLDPACAAFIYPRESGRERETVPRHSFPVRCTEGMKGVGTLKKTRW